MADSAENLFIRGQFSLETRQRREAQLCKTSFCLRSGELRSPETPCAPRARLRCRAWLGSPDMDRMVWPFAVAVRSLALDPLLVGQSSSVSGATGRAAKRTTQA